MLKHKDETEKEPVNTKEGAADESSSAGKSKASPKKKDLLAKLQRVTADFDNYQKRMARNAAETRQWARAEIIGSFLSAIDDFEQALEAGKTAQDVQSLLEGFKLVHDHLLATLDQQQVQRIETEGEKFDPEVHEAMLHQESAEHEPGTVMAELRKGYTINGRPLRPARVMVSKGPREEEPGSAEELKQSSDE